MKKIFFSTFFLFLFSIVLLPQVTCIAQDTDPDLTKTTFTNPLSFDTVEGVLGSILTTVQGIVAILAVVFLVIGGILYITSAGDEKRMTVAKGAILAAVIGFALAIAAPSFLKEIYAVLGTDSTVTAPDGGQRLSLIALNILDLLLSFVGILAVIMLVVGGIMYITAAGEESRTETAKKIVTYAIIGLGVAITALIIVTAITGLIAP